MIVSVSTSPYEPATSGLVGAIGVTPMLRAAFVVVVAVILSVPDSGALLAGLVDVFRVTVPPLTVVVAI